jgi:hypothetical protein
MSDLEELRDLALTNLVVAEIRAQLREPRAVYVKWYYGGAFNGAAWECADGNADVVFYSGTRVPNARSDEGARAAFSAGVAIAHAPALTDDGLAKLLAASESQFEALVATEGSRLLERVARVLFWCSIEARDAGEAAAGIEALADDLKAILPSSSTMTDPHPSPVGGGGIWFGDLELTLERALAESKVASALVSVIPGLGGSLFEPLGLFRTATSVGEGPGQVTGARGPHRVDYVMALGRQF